LYEASDEFPDQKDSNLIEAGSLLRAVLCKCSAGEKNNPEMRNGVRQFFMWFIMSARVARR
jgi:hypothetical protein